MAVFTKEQMENGDWLVFVNGNPLSHSYRTEEEANAKIKQLELKEMKPSDGDDGTGFDY